MVRWYDGRVVESRQRRYYTLTPPGEAAQAEARARLAELVSEVLETQEPEIRRGVEW